MASDALSVLAYADEDLMSDQEGSVTDFRPSTRANEPPTGANEPPTGVCEPQSEATKPLDEAENQSNGTTVPPNGTDLYDSDSQYLSWQPKRVLPPSCPKSLVGSYLTIK